MLNNLEIYLKDNIADDVSISEYKDTNKIPIYLKKKYKFYEARILDVQCLIIEILDDVPGINTLDKNIQRIKEITDLNIIIYYKTITRYRRKNLVMNRIAFVVENGQMYLPFLALNFNTANDNSKPVIKVFSTSVQVAYLYFLYHKDLIINATDFAQNMHWTLMRASRVLNELCDLGFLTYTIGGKTSRSKQYSIIAYKEYLEKGKVYLKDPVKKIVYLNKMPTNTLIAGLDGLSKYSMINPPKNEIRAISIDKFNQQSNEIVDNQDVINDSKLIELQLWSYDPSMFSDNQIVDKLSLYASLKHQQDERIEMALDEMLQGE